MSHELREGVRLYSVYWEDGDVTVGARGCVSLVVAEQMGDMGMLPWIKATYENGREHLYNYAQIQGCELLKEQDFGSQ